MKTKKIISKKTRQKMRLARLGKKWSKKNIKKIRQKTIEALANPEIRKKMRLAKLGKPGAKKGYKCTKKQLKNMSNAHKGQTAWNKGLKGCYKQNKETIEKRTSKMKGKNNPSWKGGITPKNHLIRTSLPLIQWRKEVFKRDNYTCQKTNEKGGRLHAHHIKNFAKYPELRFAIDNGITFSKKAHREFHKKYGFKNNTKKQIKEFLTN